MGEKEGKDGEDKKPEGGAVKVVLKVNMHCDGCAKKVKRAVRGFEGVESVATDYEMSLLTVVGKLDPWKLREKVEQKTHKTVVIISPLDPPKKEEKKPDEKPKEEVKVEEKPKPPAVNTVILSFRLHCDGCIQRIQRAIRKIKGVHDVECDAQKDLVFVKGTMDANTLSSSLETKFKKKIEVVPLPKKEEGGGEKKDNSIGGNEGGGDKKGGEDKNKDGDRSIEKKDEAKEKKDDVKEKKDEEKKKDAGKQKEDGEKKKEVDAEPKVEVNKMEYYGSGGATSQYYHSGASAHYYFASSSDANLQYFHNDGGDATRAYMPYGYPIDLSPAPQLFSDENPNGCSVM